MALPSGTYYPGRCHYFAPCIVQPDGTFALAPHGWTASKTATGVYEITHNLGRKMIPLVVVVNGSNYRFASSIEAMTDNSITVRLTDQQQPADGSFMLALMGL